MQNKLLPCPFCGGEAEFLHIRTNCDIELGYIKCTECGARMEQENCTRDFARDVWNTRKPIQQIVRKIALKTVEITYPNGETKNVIDSLKAIDIVRKGGVDNAE